jgi:hypothetical protein
LLLLLLLVAVVGFAYFFFDHQSDMSLEIVGSPTCSYNFSGQSPVITNCAALLIRRETVPVIS